MEPRLATVSTSGVNESRRAAILGCRPPFRWPLVLERVSSKCGHRFFLFRHERHLPHWDAVGQPQFVTFRLHGSLAEKRVFRREHVASSGAAFATMDRLLDRGVTGPLHLKRSEIAELVVQALMESDVRFQRCKLHAFAVMPNHAHLLATQLTPFAHWLGPLKGFTANRANKALGLSNTSFWQNESYDHLVLNNEEFVRIQRYIELNPVRAGLVERPEQFRWSSANAAWKAAGWQECPPYPKAELIIPGVAVHPARRDNQNVGCGLHSVGRSVPA